MVKLQCPQCFDWFEDRKEKKRYCSDECEFLAHLRLEQQSKISTKPTLKPLFSKRAPKQKKSAKKFIQTLRGPHQAPPGNKKSGKRHLREKVRHLEQELYRLKKNSPNSVVKTFNETKKDWGFYGTEAWIAVRYEALKLYGRRCMLCNNEGKGVIIDVDHIKPRSKHPELELDIKNLQILCRHCNFGKSNKDEMDYRP